MTNERGSMLKFDLYLWRKWRGKKNQIRGSVAYRGRKKPARPHPIRFNGWAAMQKAVKKLLREWGWEVVPDKKHSGYKFKWNNDKKQI